MIYISTNIYGPDTFMKVLKVVDHFGGQVGIELFMMNHDDSFMDLVSENMDTLRKYSFSFHGPYYETEHSADHASEKYKYTMKLFDECLDLAKDLEPEFIVYHYNNCQVNDREKMLENTRKSLDHLSAKSNFPLLIENVGVDFIGNKLLSQEEFIEECLSRPEDVLIDIGHANANGWDFERLMSALKDKIKAYHLHSNDGIHDSHQRIFENTPDMDRFLGLYKTYTPHAHLVLEYNHDFEDREDLVVEDTKRLIEALA